MSFLTDISSSSDVKNATGSLSLELELYEALRENKTCLSTELQKKLTDVSNAKSFSLLPKNLVIEDQNRQEDIDARSADINCISLRLRFLYNTAKTIAESDAIKFSMK